MTRNFIVFFEGQSETSYIDVAGNAPFVTEKSEYLNRNEVTKDLIRKFGLRKVNITNIIELSRHDLNTWIK